MFENPGGAVKVLGGIVLWGGIILSFVVALFVYGMAADSYGATEDLYNRLATIILIAGPIASIVNGVMLSAFGELVENSEIMTSKLSQLKSGVQSIEKMILKEDYTEKNVAETNAGSEASSTHKWKCIKCGQRISSLPCPYCSDK